MYSEKYIGGYTTKDIKFQGTLVIKKVDEDGTVYWIPVDEGNSDYREYLEWKASQDANN